MEIIHTIWPRGTKLSSLILFSNLKSSLIEVLLNRPKEKGRSTLWKSPFHKPQEKFTIWMAVPLLFPQLIRNLWYRHTNHYTCTLSNEVLGNQFHILVSLRGFLPH